MAADLIIEASTRDDSATLVAAKKVGAEKFSDFELVRLKNLDIPLFFDDRKDRIFASSEDLEELYMKMYTADQVLLASPVYWYNVSHLMKNFLDHWTYFLRHKTPIKDVISDTKFSTLFVGSADDPSQVEPARKTLEMSIAYIGAKWGKGYYFAESNLR